MTWFKLQCWHDFLSQQRIVLWNTQFLCIVEEITAKNHKDAFKEQCLGDTIIIYGAKVSSKYGLFAPKIKSFSQKNFAAYGCY